MYNKTTGAFFLKFGNVTENIPNDTYETEVLTRKNKTIVDLHCFDKHVIVEAIDGIAMLVIMDDDQLKTFVLHNRVKVYPHNYFNIIPLTDTVTFNFSIEKKANTKTLKLNSPFKIKRNSATFHIHEIYAYYYNVKSPGYHFNGERNPYFEITYVDNGSLHMCIDNNEYDINEYELIISGNKQFHNQSIINNHTCSYLTIIFSMDLKEYDKILNRVFKINGDILEILNRFVNDTYLEVDYKEDMMINNLKQLIINLLQYDQKQAKTKTLSPVHQHFEDEILNEIINHIKQHINEDLSVQSLCEHFSLSRSSLQNLFKNNLKMAPKKYINELKLKKSCILIKESKYNISEIANLLGFNSIHYFSRKFTQHYKITPTEYARSIFKNQKN